LVTSIPDEVDTPAVVIDHDVLDRNITRMSGVAASRGIALRPHVKTHKIPQIARLQIASGATGLTVATISEAEVFIHDDFDDVFVAYPLWLGPRHADRLRRLTARARVAIGVDSSEAATNIAAQLGKDRGNIDVLIEVDSGHHRSGIQPRHADVVGRAAVEAGLRVTGVFTFPGHGYAPGKPAEAAQQEQHALNEATASLAKVGITVDCRSGGSTPTAPLTDSEGVTEIRPGVYVFGDAQQFELGCCAPEDISLTVAATVVSRHDSVGGPRRVVLDSGSKVLGSDRPAWASGFGRLIDYLDARITALSEHHATVTWPEDAALPALGARLRVIPNHVCLTMNLVDDVTVVRDGKVIDRWGVAARGKNH
jgi:D-serine deaminase-like pyridoxal phosphate-dependent protein